MWSGKSQALAHHLSWQTNFGDKCIPCLSMAALHRLLTTEALERRQQAPSCRSVHPWLLPSLWLAEAACSALERAHTCPRRVFNVGTQSWGWAAHYISRLWFQMHHSLGKFKSKIWICLPATCSAPLVTEEPACFQAELKHKQDTPLAELLFTWLWFPLQSCNGDGIECFYKYFRFHVPSKSEALCE